MRFLRGAKDGFLPSGPIPNRGRVRIATTSFERQNNDDTWDGKAIMKIDFGMITYAAVPLNGRL